MNTTFSNQKPLPDLTIEELEKTVKEFSSISQAPFDSIWMNKKHKLYQEICGFFNPTDKPRIKMTLSGLMTGIKIYTGKLISEDTLIFMKGDKVVAIIKPKKGSN
jgi:hypothetical protein